MKTIPSTRVVFNRHNTASRTNTAAVYIEVSYQGKRNFYNTGIKVKINQFRNSRICNCGHQKEYNERIDTIRNSIDDYINSKIENREPFALDGLKEYMENNGCALQKDAFLTFMYQRIYERQISEGTRKGHLSVYNILKRWGKIKEFSDVNQRNILLWNDLSTKNAVKTKSIYNYHKVLKIYIREAKIFGYIQNNPYDVLHFKRCECTDRKYLSIDELNKFKSVELKEIPLIKARDCFLFQCYTGLAYTDMAHFNFEEMAKFVDGAYRVKEERVKTGNKYNITLLPPAMDILKKYDYKLPVQCMQVYNRNLQAIQYRAGIETRCSSHVGRHTFAVICLNNNVRIEVVKEFLGHKDIKTTAIYAKIVDKTVNKAFDNLKNAF